MNYLIALIIGILFGRYILYILDNFNDLITCKIGELILKSQLNSQKIESSIDKIKNKDEKCSTNLIGFQMDAIDEEIEE